jgi:hypothetical protein
MAKIPEFEDFFDDLEMIAGYLNDHQVEYGYPTNKMHKEAGLPVAQVAALQEEGVMNKDGSWHTVPRRFMTEAELLNENTTEGMLYDLSNAILTGKKLNVTRMLHKIGRASADDVREAILYGQYPPLKPSTIAKKGHSTPLIETEQLYNDADYKITKGDE